MSENESYLFQVSTTGVWGNITEPFAETIPVQASLALPQTGGFGTARVDRFDFRGILSFESAEALVSGSGTGNCHDSTATVTITGLNILNVVTADRVVARIASEQSRGPGRPGLISALGSSFENLRIAGYPVQPELDTDKFHELDAGQSLTAAREKNQQFHTASQALASSRTRFKEYLDKCLSRFHPESAEPGSPAICSLVRGMEWGSKLPADLQPLGHVIHVRGFGFIRLAEFRITRNTRSITMLQVDLGSSPSGSNGSGNASGGGSDP